MTDKDKIKELHAAIAADLAPQVETDEIRNRFAQHIKVAVGLLKDKTDMEFLKILGIDDFVSGIILRRQWIEGKSIPAGYRFYLFNLNSYLESLLNSYYLVSVFSNNPSTWKTFKTENFEKAIEFLKKEKLTAPSSSVFHLEKIVGGVVEIGIRNLLMKFKTFIAVEEPQPINLKEAKYGKS